jgi:hypothetical protein
LKVFINIFSRERIKMDSISNEFEQNGYCVIRSAISNELRDFITQYTLFDEMQDFSPDRWQVKNAHSKYADPAMESLLLILHEKIEQHTNLSLHPTYSFYRVYRNEDELELHKDRPSCEISATLCFNYSYPDTEYKWPIYMKNKEIILFPGDLAVYKGCTVAHWREKLIYKDENTWHVQGFFHYVDANGPYKDYKFDKRSSIGEIKDSKKIKSYITFTG